MLGKSLGKYFSKLNDEELFNKLSDDAKSLKFRVKPENVIMLDQPVELPIDIFSTENYRLKPPTSIDKKFMKKLRIDENCYVTISFRKENDNEKSIKIRIC